MHTDMTEIEDAVRGEWDRAAAERRIAISDERKPGA